MHDSDSAPRHDPDEPDRVDRADERGKSDGSDRASDPAGGGNVGESDNIDAEFAAMMEGLSLPDEMQADLESLDEKNEKNEDDDTGEEDTGPALVSVADVPHNTYTAPGARPTDDRRAQIDEVEEGADDGAGNGAGGGADDEGSDALTPEQAADIDALAAALDAQTPDPPRAVKVAVVLTPLASAEALATLCAMSDLDCVVVPARSGAFAVKELVSAHAEWDVSELLGGADTEPAEAAELASALSRLSRAGVVLLTADLATDVGIESGLSGTITARRYADGEAGEEASAGLLLASVDQEAEDVLLGITRAQDVRGALRTSEIKPGRTMRWLGRGLRRPRGDED